MSLKSDSNFYIYSATETQTWVDATDTGESRNLEGVELYKRVGDKLIPEYTFSTKIGEIPTLEEAIKYIKELGIEKIYTSNIQGEYLGIESYSLLEYGNIIIQELYPESREVLEAANIKILYLLDT